MLMVISRATTKKKTPQRDVAYKPTEEIKGNTKKFQLIKKTKRRQGEIEVENIQMGQVEKK